MGGWCWSYDEKDSATDDEPLLCSDELDNMNEEVAMTILQEALDIFDKHNHKKEAYLEALTRNVLNKESNPLFFLRMTDYDPWKAAMKLLDYWNERRNIFGSKNAYKDLMDISGNGALNKQDILVLKSGFCCNLPNDQDGHAVVFVDRHRLSQEQHEKQLDSQLRVAFYTLSKCMFNSMSQAEGVVMAGVFAFERVDPRFLRAVTKFMSSCLPIKLHRLHCIYLPKSKRLPRFCLPRDLRDARKRVYDPPKSLRFHFGRTPQDILPQLLEYGFLLHGIPKRFGGTWDYSNVYNNIIVAQKTRSYLHNGFFNAQAPCSCAYINPSMFTPGKEASSLAGEVNFLKSLRGPCNTAKAVRAHFSRTTWQEIVNFINGHLPRNPKFRDVPLMQLKFSLFENQRARLSVNQTGYGALSLSDLLCLGTSYLQILGVDKCGRTVVSFESSRMMFGFSEQLRCYYYILAVASENPISFQQGILLLVILDPMFFRRHSDLSYLAILPEIFGISTQVHVVLTATNFDPGSRYASAVWLAALTFTFTNWLMGWLMRCKQNMDLSTFQNALVETGPSISGAENVCISSRRSNSAVFAGLWIFMK